LFPHVSHPIVFACFLLLLPLTFASRDLWSWLMAVLLVAVGATSLVFPQMPVPAIAAVGVGALAVIGASRGRAKLRVEIQEIREQVLGLTAEQNRKFLRHLNMLEAETDFPARPSDDLLTAANQELALAEDPAPTPEPAQINFQPVVVAEMPAEPKQPKAQSAKKNGTIAPFTALTMPVSAAQLNGTAPAEIAVTPPANARTSRRARTIRQPPPKERPRSRDEQTKEPALAPEGT
jgi:hypothetical protein